MTHFDKGLLLYIMNLLVLGVVCVLYCLFTFCVFCKRDSVRPHEFALLGTAYAESGRRSPLDDGEDALSNVYVSTASTHLFPRSAPIHHSQNYTESGMRHLDHDYRSSTRYGQNSLDNSLVNAIRRQEAPPANDPPPPYECFQPPNYSCLY